MPSAPVGPTTVASGAGGPLLPPVDQDALGWSAIAGVGAAILSGIGSVGSFLAHPFAPPA